MARFASSPVKLPYVTLTIVLQISLSDVADKGFLSLNRCFSAGRVVLESCSVEGLAEKLAQDGRGTVSQKSRDKDVVLRFVPDQAGWERPPQSYTH